MHPHALDVSTKALCFFIFWSIRLCNLNFACIGELLIGDAPRRSARISEKVKTPEAEKSKRASSSGSQRGTKRKKNTEDDGLKVEGDGSGSERRSKRKKNTEDEHKVEGEVCAAEGEGPKDVDMEETKGNEHINSKEEASKEGIKTKENVEESLEQPVESQGAIKHGLADKVLENDDEKVEQDVEQSEGKVTKLELGNEAKENQNGTEISPPASDSEKAVLIVKADEVSDSKKDEASVCKTDAEILSQNGSEMDIEVSPAVPDSKKATLIEKDAVISTAAKDEASIHLKDAGNLPENDGENEVNAAPDDNLEPGKEVNENLNVTEVSPPTFDSEKIDLTAKDGEASAAAKKDEASVFMKDAEILSENGEKKDKVEGNLVHNNCDDGKMSSESFPANR